MTAQFRLSHKDFVRRFQDKSIDVEVDDDALEEYNTGKKKENKTFGILAIIIGVFCIAWIWWVGLGLIAVGIFGMRSHEDEKEGEVISRSLRASVFYDKYIEKGILKIEESSSDDEGGADDDEEVVLTAKEKKLLREEEALQKREKALKARLGKAPSPKPRPAEEEEENA
jgi:hypothetical protein